METTTSSTTNDNRLSLPASFFVEALYPFNGEDTASLSFQKGDIIEVLTQLPSGWWDGVMWRQRERGWFPSNYTRRLTDQEAEFTRAQLESIKQTSDPNIINIHQPTQSNSNHPARLSMLTIEPEHQPTNPSSFDSQPPQPPSNTLQPSQPPTTISSSSTSTSIQPPLNSSSNSWAAWLPKVTEDGQIYYYNNLTGEIASEMPMADYELDQDSLRLNHHHHHLNSPSQSHLQDPLKFLEDNGFSKEILQKHGLLTSLPPSPTQLSKINQSSTNFGSTSSPSSSAPICNSSLDSANLLQPPHLNPSSEFNSSSSNSSTQPLPSDPQPTTNPSSSSSSSDPINPELTRDSNHHHLHSDHRPSSSSSSNLLLTTGGPSKNIFQASQHLKIKLKPVIQVPPTLTFSRMADEIKEAISLLTKLTEPTPEDPTSDYSSSSSPSSNLQPPNTHSQHARDQLSRASINLVDKIRFLLQASCQLDTSVLSILNDSHFPLHFNSLSITQNHRSSTSPISPYIPSRDSTLSSQYSAGSHFQSLFSNPHLNLPGLKHVSRKIASTLSKLTLSTRALWGLLSIRSVDLFQILDESSSTPLDIQQNAQNRYALEQKLRSECRMGVSDLSASVDAFFQHFESILIDQSSSINSYPTRPAPPTGHFPRHGHGHLLMPLESVFLPGGAQGGNWKGSGYDPAISVISEHSGPATGGAQSPLSKRSTSTPSSKLDSESLTVRLLPLIRQTRELAESIISLLAVDADEILITSEPTELNCIDRLSAETADLVLTQVLGLIESAGQLLATSESFDLASTLEVDLDPFMWLELEQDSSLLKGLSEPVPDSLASIHTQLQFARRLVGGYQRSKQAVYDLAADLVYASQTILTSGAAFRATSIPSPAQPLSASPLFTVHQPASPGPSPGRLVKTARRLVLALESLAIAAGAIVQESSVQNGQDINLSGINQLFKNVIFPTTLPSSSSDSFMPNAIPRRLKSNSSANASSVSSFRNLNLSHSNPPPSPRHLLHSRGIEEEQAELDGSSVSALPRDNSIDGGHSITRKREPSIVVQEADRPESASSKSPTRSKKLAKFFGEEAATSVMPAPKPVSSKPVFLMADYGPDDISFNVDNQIRGGTLKGLVIKLTSHEGPDVPFLRVFLMTYRTFTTSHAFLDLLIERYHQQPPPGLLAEELQLWTDQKQKVIKIRVINVIRSWIESHLSDEDADSIIQRVIEFSTHDMGDTNLARQVALTCERRQSRGALSKMTPMQAPGNPPPSIPPRNPRKIKFLDIDPLELARQLSLVESKLFCQIQANECLGKAWPKEFAKEGTPNIKAMIDMSNALTRWVAETILLQAEQKKRASTIKHFILVADRCRSLNNFSTLMQIIAGLNSTPIYRLRRTWETIPQKTLTLFAQLGAVMSPTKNYAAYRDTIRNMAPPCVPFVGVYLTDWTFIGDGNPDQLREKPQQINFNKRQKAAELIVQIQSYQSMLYQLNPMPSIVKFLEDSLENPRDEKELYDLSLELEPRERDDEKIARLLAESGFL